MNLTSSCFLKTLDLSSKGYCDGVVDEGGE